MNSDKEENLLAKWLEGEIKDQELNDQNLLQELTNVVNASESLGIPPMDNTKVRAAIDLRITSNQPSAKEFNLRRAMIVGAAAVVAILLMFTLLINNDVTIISKVGENIAHTLPDKSEVILSSNSSMSYEEAFNQRTLKLGGEAFFKVEKGSKFIVQTTLGNIEVLGTSFDINARGETLTVKCKTGKVKVTAKGESYILTPGLMVRIPKNNSKKQEIDQIESQLVGSWLEGEYYYKSTPYIDVVNNLSAVFGLTIDLPKEHQNKLYSGSFVTADKVKALKMVFSPMNINYTIDNDNVVSFVDN